MLIEDNVDAAESLRELLVARGHEVTIARDGQTGIAMARSQPPDVVLCDIGLPGVDGYEIARTIRADHSLDRVKMVALTGYASDEDVARAKSAGFAAHLVKPPSIEAITAVLAA